MRNHEHGDAQLAIQSLQENLHLLTGRGVQATRGLICYDHFRMSNDGAGDPNALLLPPDNCRG